jgi:hypothetical protein
MKIKRLLVLGLSFAIWGSEIVPVYSQLFQTSSPDTTALLNLLRNYGAIENIVIINKYALVRYFYGQNGGQITLKQQQNKWIIIDGERQGRFCRDVDCLVSKGVPRPSAQQLFERLNKSDEKKKQFQAFLDYWAKKNRNIVPFLGYYANQQWPYSSPEITLSIWPSSTLDKVCLVGITNTSQYFQIGQVKGKSLKINNRTFTFVYEYEGVNDAALQDSTEKMWLINLNVPLNIWYFNQETVKKLKDAGCTNEPQI